MRASEHGEQTAPDYREEQRQYRESKRNKPMAVDMSGGVIVPAEAQPASPGIMGRIEQHPIAALFIALVIAVVIGFLINRLRGTSSTTSTTSTTNQPGTTQGLPTTDAQGNKVYYVPTSNTFLDYNNIQDSYNPNNSVATTTTSTVNTTNSSAVNNGQSENAADTHTTATYGPKPLIPYGQYKGPNYSNLPANTHYTYHGINYLLKPGGSGRLWGITPWGQQVLLYGTQDRYGPSYTPAVDPGWYWGTTPTMTTTTT